MTNRTDLSFRLAMLAPAEAPAESMACPSKNQVLAANILSSMQRHSTATLPRSLSDERGIQWLNQMDDDLDQIDALYNRILDKGEEGAPNAETLANIDTTLLSLGRKLDQVSNQPIGKSKRKKKASKPSQSPAFAPRSELQERMKQTHQKLDRMQAYLLQVQTIKPYFEGLNAEWLVLKQGEVPKGFKNFTGAFGQMKALLQLYNSLAVLPESEKLQLQAPILATLSDITKTQPSYTAKLRENLQNELTNAKRDLENAQSRLLGNKIKTADELVQASQAFEVALQAVRQLENYLADYSEVLHTISLEKDPSIAEKIVASLPTDKRAADQLRASLQLANDYHALIGRIKAERTPISQMLAACAVPGGDIERCREAAKVQLAKLGPGQKLELPKPLTEYICQRDIAQAAVAKAVWQQEQNNLDIGKIPEFTLNSYQAAVKQAAILIDLDRRIGLLPIDVKMRMRKEIRESLKSIYERQPAFAVGVQKNLKEGLDIAWKELNAATEKLNSTKVRSLENRLKEYQHFENAVANVRYFESGIAQAQKTAQTLLQSLQRVPGPLPKEYQLLLKNVEENRLAELIAVPLDLHKLEEVRKQFSKQLAQLDPQGKAVTQMMVEPFRSHREKFGTRTTAAQRQTLLQTFGVLLSLLTLGASQPLSSAAKEAAALLSAKSAIDYATCTAEQAFGQVAAERWEEAVVATPLLSKESTAKISALLDASKESTREKEVVLNLPPSQEEQLFGAVQLLYGAIGGPKIYAGREATPPNAIAVSEKSGALSGVQSPPPTVVMSTAAVAASTNKGPQIAEERGSTKMPPLDYGNKHARIVELHDLFQGDADVVVPLPHGLATQHVEAFIAESAPDTFRNWQELGDRFKEYQRGHTPEQAPQFLNEKGVPELLASIQEGIRNAFSVAAIAMSLFENILDLAKLEGMASLTDWLKEISSTGSDIIVRSTGKEDSAVANAGGNLSVSYIPPTPEAALTACGEVIASYFSPASLRNLLTAKTDPFAGDKNMAVTMQEMIGEPVGGATDPQDIPISVVMFTNEPYYVGNNVGSDKFRVMRISATFGHGEGVVGAAGVATDTVLVLQSRSDPSKIYYSYDNQRKAERLAPKLNPTTGKVELTLTKNPPGFTEKRALDDKMIKKLVDIGIRSEKRYDKPYDEELVIKRGKVHVVQGRPVNREQTIPTYIDPNKIAAAPQGVISEMPAKTLVPGKASAVTARSPSEVLLSDTLAAAEDPVTGFVEGRHHLIVTGKDEPANSHPVVNFSGMAVPCLYAKDTEKAASLIDQAGKEKTIIMACMQQGKIYLWDEAAAPAESLVTEGYVSHPAPIKISLELPKEPATLRGHAKVFIPPDLQDLFYAVKMEKEKEVAKSALKKVKEHPFLQKLAEKHQALKGRISKLGDRPAPHGKLALEAIEKLSQKADEAMKELESAFETHDVERLEILFHAKVLETLYFADESNEGGVSQLSILSLEGVEKAAEVTMDYQERLPFPALLTDESLYMDAAVDERVEQNWLEFLHAIENYVEGTTGMPTKAFDNILEIFSSTMPISKIDIENFKESLKLVKELGALPTWISVCFDSVNNKSWNAKQAFHALVKEFDAETLAFLKDLKAKRGQLSALKNAMGGFADPKTFEAAFELLKQSVAAFSNEDFIAKMFHGTKLSKIMAVETMREMVNLYDQAVKTMKSSRQIDISQKPALFQNMLKPYFQFFERSYYEITHPYKYPRGYFHRDKVMDLFNAEATMDSLKPSPEFSVRGAILSNEADTGLHVPKTLEDLFTFIHQNLLSIAASLTSKSIDDATLMQMNVPPMLKNAISLISSSSRDFDKAAKALGESIQRVGIEFSTDAIVVTYNKPLRQHSTTATLIYDENTRSLKLEIEFFKGPTPFGGEEERHDVVEAYARLTNRVNNISFAEKTKVNNRHLKMSWNISSERVLKVIMQDYLRMIYYTMSSNIQPLFAKYISGEEIEMIKTCINDSDSRIRLAGLFIIRQRYIHDVNEIPAGEERIIKEFLMKSIEDPDPTVRLEAAHNLFNERIFSFILNRGGDKASQEMIDFIVKILKSTDIPIKNLFYKQYDNCALMFSYEERKKLYAEIDKVRSNEAV